MPINSSKKYFDSPFNILYIHEMVELGGGEESLLNLMRFLNRESFKPLFILPKEGRFSEKLRELEVNIFIVPMPRIRDIRGVVSSAGKMFQIARENKAHLLHTDSIRTHLYGTYLAKRLKIPIVWHGRNLIDYEIIDPDRLFFFLPNKIICNSYAVAKRFLRRGKLPNKVVVNYNGVDINRFSPHISAEKIRKEFNIGPDEIVVGIASRFNPNKGHETFFQAARILLNEMPSLKDKLRFLSAGAAVFGVDKYREKYLRDMVDNLGLNERVIFAGFREDMPEVYAAMDILILPSYIEACSRVLLEVMASGKAVIATNSGGTPEIVKDGITGFLFEPGNHRVLADKLATLVSNINLAKKMGEAGRKRVEENFTIEKNVEQIEGVYRELIHNK